MAGKQGGKTGDDPFYGVPQDPTGVDRTATDAREPSDQRAGKGEQGKEGGAAGRFTRAPREEERRTEPEDRRKDR